jgi:hypothetical protein
VYWRFQKSLQDAVNIKMNLIMSLAQLIAQAGKA